MKTKLFFTMIVITEIVYGQAPDWEWAKRGSGNQSQVGYCSITDKNENVYATGSYSSSTLIFDGITLNNAINSFGSLFIVKYNFNGIVQWAKSVSSYPNANIASTGITVDTSGSIYVTGWYNGSYTVFENDTLFNTGFQSNIFLVKYDTSGNVVWAKNISGNRNDEAKGITSDLNGNIYVTGFFRSDTLSFGNMKLVNTFVNYGTPNPFVCKINSMGQTIWVKKGILDNNACNSEGNGIALDQAGNVYITGSYTSITITFDSITLTNSHLLYKEVFIVKLNNSGNTIWAKSAGGTDHDEGHGIAADNSGNVFIMGIFWSSSIAFDNDTLNVNESMNNFLVKLDSAGNAIWARQFGRNIGDLGMSIRSDSYGNALLAGYYGNDTITFGNNILVNNVGDNIFVVKYNPSGNSEWAKSTGNAPYGTHFNNYANGICINDLGNIYVTGSIDGTKIPFGHDSLSSIGYDDFFIAKFSFITVDPSSTILCSGDSVLLSANGATTYTWSPSTGLSNTTGDTVIASPTSSITYTVTGIKNGYIAHSTAAITVKSSPSVPIITQSDSLLTSSSFSGNQWYLNDSVIPGATHHTYLAMQNGNYMVCVTNYNGCTSCSAPYVITDLGIVDGITKNGVSIIPNPNNGSFHIVSGTNILIIEIINMLGQEIYKSVINSNSAEISLPKVSPGIHFVRLFFDGTFHHNEKIIIVN